MAEGHLDEEQIAARILMLLKKKSEARLLVQQHQQRMANVSHRPQLFYSPHAHWGSNFWHFPSPLYDISPMPPSYQFAPPAFRTDLALPQRPVYYGMTANPHYSNTIVATPHVDPESKSCPTASPTSTLRLTHNTTQSLTPTCLPDSQKTAIKQTPTSTSDSHKPTSRRKRRNFSEEQKKILEAFYLSDQNPLFEDRLQLEKLTKLSEDRIHIWFQNRRAKDRRKQQMARLLKQSREKPLSADSSAREAGTARSDEIAEQRLHQYEDSEQNTNDSHFGSEGLESEEVGSEEMGSEEMGSEGVGSEDVGSSDDENTGSGERLQANSEKEHVLSAVSVNLSNSDCLYNNAHFRQRSQFSGLQQHESSRYGGMQYFQKSDAPRSSIGQLVAELPTGSSLVRSPLISRSQVALGESRVLQYVPHFQRVLLPEAATRQLTGLSFTLVPEMKRTLLPSTATACQPTSKDTSVASNGHAHTESSFTTKPAGTLTTT